MPRALIAALLLAGCGEVETATLGSNFRDAGRVDPGPLPGSCDDIRGLLEEIRAEAEAGDTPSSCSLEPFYDPKCPTARVYRAITKCLSELAQGLPPSIDNDRDD